MILFDKKTMVAVPQHKCTLNMKDNDKHNLENKMN